MMTIAEYLRSGPSELDTRGVESDEPYRIVCGASQSLLGVPPMLANIAGQWPDVLSEAIEAEEALWPEGRLL